MSITKLEPGDIVCHKTSDLHMVVIETDIASNEIKCSYLVMRKDEPPIKGTAFFQRFELNLKESGNFDTQHKAQVGQVLAHKSNPGLGLVVVSRLSDSLSKINDTFKCSFFYPFDEEKPKKEFDFIEYELTKLKEAKSSEKSSE